jgi:hypothetical protein
MNAAFIDPAMQRERINSKGSHYFRERNKTGSFPTLLAVRRGHGTTTPNEDRFRGFDGDLAYHAFPPLQGVPLSGWGNKAILATAGGVA